MHKFPPGFTRRLAIGGAIALVAVIIFGAVIFGGRPTARDEANRSAQEIGRLIDAANKHRQGSTP